MDNKIKKGLNNDEVIASRKAHGSNKMTKRKGKSFFRLFFENLGDPVIRVLLISLAVNIVFTLHDIDWFETGGIIIAILLASTISTFSEYSSHSAFEKINASAKQTCRVWRNGELISINSDEIVVGDIIFVSAGEKISADGILISGALSLDQSAMTGESREAHKKPFSKLKITPDKINKDELSPDFESSCLRGCLVSSGEGEMIVCRVGDNSFLGGIVQELQNETRDTPLKIRLSKLAKQISTLGYGAAVVIALLSLFSSVFIESDFVREVIASKITDPKFMISELLHAITLGLTVVIMAVPEGLPMMIAVVLSSNVKKMLNDMVLVRKSAGIEAAGSMNILFTDKTGTLTRGQMTIEGFILADGTKINEIKALRENYPDIFLSFCKNSCYNTSARITNRRASGGNATERALLDATKRFFIPDHSKNVQKMPFDSKIKYSSAIVDGTTYVKGAPEILLVGSKNTDRFPIEHAITKEQNEGKRVIAMLENNKFTCAVIISDPPRREAKSSVEALKNAGVDVVMITGDGILTAQSIAEQTGIINSRRNLCLEHKDLEKMTDDELINILPRLAVLARALPQDKSRLVRLAQSKDLVVGMTGDGINDAPALRLSDVGFAMGNGSDVAKEAGDVVILDNNLASIVKAVLYGRNIFKSIRKFLVFQLTMNFSSALVCMIAPFFEYETPITVSQMLWVNMIMDTLGGLAFAGESPHKRMMREKPKRRDEPILNGYMAHQILISGTFSAILSICFLKLPFFASHFRSGKDNIVLLSAFFGLFIFLGVMQCINSRTDRLNLLNGITKNPTFILIMLLILAIQVSFIYFGGTALRATPLTPNELLFTFTCAAIALPLELIRKIIWRFSGHTSGF
ncbi:MAG: cation-translocating P-type ATPase [Clostridia bacterium]|nr:cation-translocating P-type ATPase [Clostridia bacterium]